MAAELSVAARNGVDAIKERKQAQTAQLTFGHAYAEYMASLARKGASAATIRLCEKNHRLYLGQFEKRVLTELTRAELRAFHASLGTTREDGRERRAALDADGYLASQ